MAQDSKSAAQISLANKLKSDQAKTDQIKSLLEELAAEARHCEDLFFAVRTQFQAAALLWPHDRDSARSIYRRALESISDRLTSDSSPGPATGAAGTGTGSQAALQQLRVELMDQIAKHDPELAEQLARTIAFTKPFAPVDSYSQDAKNTAIEQASSPVGPASPAGRELLIEMALQLAEHDSGRAMTLAQLSLTAGISPNFGRLLMTMRAVNPQLADLLFSNSIAVLEQTDAVDISGVRTLVSYLVATPVTAVNDSINKQIISRFLILAMNRIAWCAEQSVNDSGQQAGGTAPVSDNITGAYFLGRQLTGLISRYLPDRLSELEANVIVLGQSSVFERRADQNATTTSGQKTTGDPKEIESEAGSNQNDGERNALFVRAALAWLSAGNTSAAGDAASRISDTAIRDRVLVQIARRQASDGRIEEAIITLQKIESNSARVGVMIKLAAVLASKDRGHAAELLGQAEREAFKEAPSIDRARELLTIAAGFLSFDSARAREVMQGAVKAINDVPTASWIRSQPLQVDSSRPVAGASASFGGKGLSFNLDFEGSLAVLARNDYDDALALAKQITGKEVSMMAQLAVCRGGLASLSSNTGDSSEGDEGEPGGDQNYQPH